METSKFPEEIQSQSWEPCPAIHLPSTRTSAKNKKKSRSGAGKSLGLISNELKRNLRPTSHFHHRFLMKFLFVDIDEGLDSLVRAWIIRVDKDEDLSGFLADVPLGVLPLSLGI